MMILGHAATAHYFHNFFIYELCCGLEKILCIIKKKKKKAWQDGDGERPKENQDLHKITMFKV